MKAALILTAFAAALLLAGCKASVPQETGFLSDYSKLQAKSNTSLVYVDNQKLGQYSKFIVDPIQTRFYDQADTKKVDQQKLSALQDYFHSILTQDLEQNGYQVVSQPGPDVARIRVAITDLKKGTPILNVIPQTAIAGAGLGGATGEMEVVDSQTNQQIAAAVESQLGKRFSMAGLSSYGNAQAIMNEWAQRFVKRLNETHGRY